jgi:hypothetical protein
MKQASLPDLEWGIDQIEGAATTLKDILVVWKTRTPGNPGLPAEPSVADSVAAVDAASKKLQAISESLLSEAEKLRAVRGQVVEKRGSVQRVLDRRLKSQISEKLEREGLDGNGRFQKAEHGLQKAFSVLSDFGIEPDDVVNSFAFSRPSGRITVDLAFTGADVFRPEPITNSMLVLTFHELAPYQFEVLAYLS